MIRLILSGYDIMKRMKKGDIQISPFDKNRLNPNSYNLTLDRELLVYGRDATSYVMRGEIHKKILPIDIDDPLDIKTENPVYPLTIPDSGIVMEPGHLYLCKTREYTRTKNLVPMLEGRSSIGRLGISIHVTAGFGDVGFEGYWTLEMHCIIPIRIYPGIEIAQIYYHTVSRKHRDYRGKYYKNTGVQKSMIYQELKK